MPGGPLSPGKVTRHELICPSLQGSKAQALPHLAKPWLLVPAAKPGSQESTEPNSFLLCACFPPYTAQMLMLQKVLAKLPRARGQNAQPVGPVANKKGPGLQASEPCHAAVGKEAGGGAHSGGLS